MSNQIQAQQAAKNPCLPDEAPGYTSADPEADWARFQDAMKTIVSVPKESVDKAMVGGQEERAKGRGGKAE